MAKHFLVGAVIGVPAAIVGIVSGIPGVVVAIIAVVLIASIARLPAVLAGGLVGLGGTWLVLFTKQAFLCAEPGQVCGATPIDMTPWVAFSSAVLFVGVLMGGFALARRT